MVEKIFWQDPYLHTLHSRIRSVAANEVRLEASIFFAFSGGQESDAGSIGGYPVLQAVKDAYDLAYTLPAGHTLQAGDTVQIAIDWPRRYRLMRLHFAAEMILQLIYQQCPGIVRIGAHISADKARIDFAHDSSLAQLLPVLQEKSAALVQADLPIQCDYSDQATQRRYWEVPGFARMACGGTHPRTTGEVGTLGIKRKNPGKGKERLEISLI
jgi:alanyl-tRNA synthetase